MVVNHQGWASNLSVDDPLHESPWIKWWILFPLITWQVVKLIHCWLIVAICFVLAKRRGSFCAVGVPIVTWVYGIEMWKVIHYGRTNSLVQVKGCTNGFTSALLTWGSFGRWGSPHGGPCVVPQSLWFPKAVWWESWLAVLMESWIFFGVLNRPW